MIIDYVSSQSQILSTQCERAVSLGDTSFKKAIASLFLLQNVQYSSSFDIHLQLVSPVKRAVLLLYLPFHSLNFYFFNAFFSISLSYFVLEHTSEKKQKTEF